MGKFDRSKHRNLRVGRNLNKKIVILPILIQKYILQFIYSENGSFPLNFYFNYNGRIPFMSFPLVNWNWFKMCQKIFSNYYHFPYSRVFISSSSDIYKYKLMNIQIIKILCISIIDISDEVVGEINTLEGLESITIINYFDSWFGSSYWRLKYLNKLRDDIVVNFDLNLGFPNLENDRMPNEINHTQALTFKSDNISINFQYEIDDKFEFVCTDIISKLNFKSLKFHFIIPTHFLQYHSISKSNKNFESVIINNDYIPLYSLYRFLKSPNLHTLNFSVNFYSLSKLYTNFNQYQHQHQHQHNIDFENFDQTINEDEISPCPLTMKLPSYSMQLWNECVKLIGSNTTITEMSILNADCHECDAEHDQFELDNGFLNDFIDTFSNNKTIKTLTINFGDNFSFEFLVSKMVTMLNQNSTLENLNLYGVDFNILSKKTTNKKCRLSI
ncbi:hypothetical protein ACTFIW_002727 [Dictyostelium discoideum]